jgi:hypothetical protein
MRYFNRIEQKAKLEERAIFLSDAISEPDAMMIKCSNTSPTILAMLRSF